MHIENDLLSPKDPGYSLRRLMVSGKGNNRLSGIFLGAMPDTCGRVRASKPAESKCEVLSAVRPVYWSGLRP